MVEDPDVELSELLSEVRRIEVQSRRIDTEIGKGFVSHRPDSDQVGFGGGSDSCSFAHRVQRHGETYQKK